MKAANCDQLYFEILVKTKLDEIIQTNDQNPSNSAQNTFSSNFYLMLSYYVHIGGHSQNSQILSELQ